MRLLQIFLIFYLVLFISCTTLLDESTRNDSSNSTLTTNAKLTAIIKTARYDIDNINIFQDENNLTGVIISTKGTYTKQRFLKQSQKYFYVSGSNNGYPAEFVVFLDHPLPEQRQLNENLEMINPGKIIRVFGKITGVGSYLLENGTTKKIPHLEAIAIYNFEDKSFRRPLWVNYFYQ